MEKHYTPTVAYNLINTFSNFNTPIKQSDKPLVSPSGSLIDDLVTESKHWFDNAYRASNDQLYDLLTKCYGYYVEMGKTGDLAKALRDDLQAHIEAKGYRFNSGTHTLNKIVKCVFGFDRRRVSAYGTVLKIALQEKITVDGLGDFIRQQGGVEEVRLSKSGDKVSTKQKAEQVASVVESSTIGRIDHDLVRQQMDAGNVGKHTLLVGTWQADGSILVRAVVDNESLVKTVLASQYSKHRQSLDLADSEVTKKTEQSKVTQAVNQAVEMARLAA